MRQTVRGVALCAVVMIVLAGAGRVAAQTISGLTINKNAGNSADNFQDGLTLGFQRTSVAAIQSSSATTFTTRYSSSTASMPGLSPAAPTRSTRTTVSTSASPRPARTC
jgi:hypothetical protein